MARKITEEAPDNHERWLVSYADFITLLFAFFVVMYALSTVNEGKYRILSDSLIHAFRNVDITTSTQVAIITPGLPIPIIPKAPPSIDKAKEAQKQKQREKMRNVAREILEVMAPLVEQGKVRVMETDRGVTVEINDSVLFDTGLAIPRPEIVKAMHAIAEVLAPTDFPITIEGHTDNVPINTVQFPSNWELSAVRATTVLRLFLDKGIDAKQLTPIGYADTRPVESNNDIAGRARNRRVNILIESNAPMAGAEVDLIPPPPEKKPVTRIPATLPTVSSAAGSPS